MTSGTQYIATTVFPMVSESEVTALWLAGYPKLLKQDPDTGKITAFSLIQDGKEVIYEVYVAEAISIPVEHELKEALVGIRKSLGKTEPYALISKSNSLQSTDLRIRGKSCPIDWFQVALCGSSKFPSEILVALSKSPLDDHDTGIVEEIISRKEIAGAGTVILVLSISKEG